jgi:hypothetical protein
MSTREKSNYERVFLKQPQNDLYFENKFFLPKNKVTLKNNYLNYKSKRFLYKRIKVHEIGLKKILKLNNNFTIITIVFHKARQSYILMVYVPFSRRKLMLKIEFETSFEQLNFQSNLLNSLKDYNNSKLVTNQQIVFNKHTNLKKKLNTKKRKNFSQFIKPIKNINLLSKKKNYSIFENKTNKNQLSKNLKSSFDSEDKDLIKNIFKDDLNKLNRHKKVVLKNKNRQNLTEFMFRFSFAVTQSHNNELKEFENICKDFSLDSQISYFHTLEYLKSKKINKRK